MASTSEKDRKCQKISVSLIAKRNILKKNERSADETAAELLKLSHVRLDREQISEIDNLDCLGPVTNLYLQKNEIRRIENLDVLPKLRFLTLAENKIIKVENLKILTNLQFLDLSDNQIETFEAGKFPVSLIILLLKGNPCSQHEDYKRKLLEALPTLHQLDGEEITRQDRLEAGCAVSESESDEESDNAEEDETELESGEHKQGSLQQHFNDMLVRAKIRTIKEEKEHEKRMEQLASIRDLQSQRTSSRASSRR
ncbi:leucine-rich repeat-containing protein 46-like [Orbicella faveolata]|uniref:leucine-rich repeat-containing protein 46-like n=1 Tax=Orbicella faveolata TaxID=48498 RepID=UPI0009E1A099|nr:leucine-rich repeat-containing protein 46-like [Orbicella faveolata]